MSKPSTQDTGHARIAGWAFTSGLWASMSGAAAKVYAVLAMHADSKTGVCWPSTATIAKLAGLHRGNVSRAVAQLVELRMIKIQQRGGGRGNTGQYRTTRYKVLRVAPAQCSNSGSVSAGASERCAGARQRTRQRKENQPMNQPSEPCAAGAADGVLRPVDGNRAGASLRMTVDDLRDTAALLAAWGRYADAGKIGRSDADRLNFVAAAEHALRVGNEPPKLFFLTIDGKHWGRITQADEDKAQTRLKAHDHGQPPRRRVAPDAFDCVEG